MADRSQHPGQIMETQTRYDLNTAIESWRSELAAQPNLTAEVRRELETHLRDTIAGFQQRGLNDEESFWLACKRVGHPPQLAEEFVKADPAKVWRERVFWMWLAVFLSSTLGSLANSIYIVLIPRQANSHIGVQVTMQTILFILAFLVPIIIGVLLAKGKWIAPFSRLTRLVENRPRLTISIFTCVALSSLLKVVAFNDAHFSNSLSMGFVSACYPVIIALLLVWLMPQQNQKTPKRA
jgi:hypothetical protein